MVHLPPRCSSRFHLHCSYLSSTYMAPHFAARRDAPRLAEKWWLLLPEHVAEGLGFFSSFSLAPWLLLLCVQVATRVCAARGSQRCRDPMFPQPLCCSAHVFLCIQKLLQPDVLIYNPYTGKQLGLPSRRS